MKSNTPHVSRSGESYQRIIRYFLPELITALVIYSVLNLFDAWLIADLKKTILYATAGVTGTLMQFFTKVAEGLGVGTIVLCGHHNGRGESTQAGKAAISALWSTALIGAIVSCFLFIGAPWIFSWYGVSQNMANLGVPFLRIRAVGIFFMFLYFAFIGFLRGIKNTRVPMILFVTGALFFIFFDWTLVGGHCGFSQYALQGSAIAFLIQHIVMCIGAVLYLTFNKNIRPYGMHILKSFNVRSAQEILKLSLPVMVDKATIAWSKMLLIPALATLGELSLASFSVIKDMEQLALIPVIALGQVITLLVSNDAGAGNWEGAKSNLKKVLILSLIFMGIIIVTFLFKAHDIIGIFDREGTFTAFTMRAFPIMILLGLLDLLQVILAASLRGSGDVRSVMYIRLIVCALFFVPAMMLFARIPIESTLVKFLLIYGAFYITNGITSLWYIKRLAGKEWHMRFNK